MVNETPVTGETAVLVNAIPVLVWVETEPSLAASAFLSTLSAYPSKSTRS